MFRVNQPKRRIYIIGFFIIGVIVGAGCFQLYNSVAAPNSAAPLSQDQTYLNAIEDAIVAKPSEVYSGLTPIVENNSNLVWQGTPGNESVLMVTWTKYASNYPVNGTVTTSWGETWVTTAPQIQLFFKDHVNSGVNATLRAAQLLGLPANTTDTYFVELWVNPQSLFRPSPDNEITDTTASLTFPANTTADYKA